MSTNEPRLRAAYLWGMEIRRPTPTSLGVAIIIASAGWLAARYMGLIPEVGLILVTSWLCAVWGAIAADIGFSIRRHGLRGLIVCVGGAVFVALCCVLIAAVAT